VAQKTNSARDDYTPNCPENGEIQWYEVQTVGVSTRAYQMAFGCFSFQRNVFVRYKHDSEWSGWFRIGLSAV
jgi:hypothetical protein